MEQRNDWGYPVLAPLIPTKVWMVCIRLLLVALMALGLAMIPAADQSPPQQGTAVPAAEVVDPYTGMTDDDLMAGVVLEPEGE